jgi:hypothetical protein
VIAHPLIEKLAAAAEAMGAPEAVEISGRWSTSRRKTYKDPGQAGSGAGPFAEVIDARWTGTLQCTVPIAGYAFLVMPTDTFWVKSRPAALNPPVEVSVHCYADNRLGRATFAASLLGAMVPSVPITCGDDPTAACTLGGTVTATGRAHEIAAATEASFVILLLPKSLLKVGRNRLWRLRREIASSLPPELRVLVGGRTGVLRR